MTSYLGRQAVVLVHGIGEQKPLSTLMGFVGGEGSGTAGVLEADDSERWFVGPDHVTNRLDLRRVTINFSGKVPLPPADLGLDVKPMPRQTHFFEYYWANRFRGTEKRHLTEWARALLFVPRDGLTQEALIGPQGRRRTFGMAGVALAWLGVALALVALLQGSADVVPSRWLPDRWWLYLAVGVLGLLAVAIAGTLGLVTLLRTTAGLVATGAAAAVLEGLGVEGRAELVWGWTLASAVVAAAAFLVTRRLDAPALRWLTVVALLSLGASLAPAALAAPPDRAALGVLAAAAVTFGTAWLGRLFLDVVGDAARYFTNSPGNLEDREEIRLGLVKLLTELHDRRDPVTGQHEYDRVVVVAHSLGSVIAYDALTALWARRSPLLGLSHSDGEPTDRLEMLLREAEAEVGNHPGVESAGDGTGAAFDPDRYRRIQDRLFRVAWADSHDVLAGERQPGGSRWIVSDLVTLGSPLTYAEALLVEGGQPALRIALRQRLLHRCPPVPQRSESQSGTPLRFRWWKGPGQGHGTHFHHAATFAVTRWTNLYYADDLVGGPLASQLGLGIDDVPLPSKEAKRSLLRFVLRMPHTKYWRHANGADPVPRGFAESVGALRRALTAFPLVVKVRMLPRHVPTVCDVIARQDYLMPTRGSASDAEVRLQVYHPSSRRPKVRSWWLWAQPEIWCPVDRLPDLVEALTTEGGLSANAVRVG